MAELDDVIEAYALENAVKYGEARTEKILPKVIGKFPEVKQDIAALKAKIASIVTDVNTRTKDNQAAKLRELSEMITRPEQKKRELPELKNALPGKVVTRLPPEPSKYNHLGHALTFIINALYAKKYDGKLVLRFEDANPEKVSQEFVDIMISDIKDYLGITPDDTRFVSDDMEQLLGYAEQLIEKNAAYMCFCPREAMTEKRRAGEECSLRENKGAKNLEEWKHFVDGKYMNGEAVLRFKGEMQHKNTVMRDPVLFRAVAAPHFRKGDQYKVWPLYDFYSGIEEHLCGVTHVIRSNEFDLRIELQHAIQDLLGLRKPEVVHYGRFNITGATTKGREIRELIESDEYLGWDDPRLVTLQALKRRGIQRQAYYELVQEIGLSPYQVNLDFSKIAAINRRLLDNTADRYSFLEHPVEIAVEGASPHDVQLHSHPERKDSSRLFHVTGAYLVAKKDLALMKGKRTRLMGDVTIAEENGKYTLVSADVKEGKHQAIVNWLPADPEQTVPVEIMMPDAQIAKGRAERAIQKLNVDDVIQFERFGFCRFDGENSGTYTFWYAHD